jgi:uncharacterized membrane protein YdjX (TVP38/TMEM64 family)
MASASSTREPLRTSDWLRLGIPVLLVAAFLIAAWKLGYFSLEQSTSLGKAASKARSKPFIAPAFIAAYATVAAFAAPVSPMAYAGGAMFGLASGCLWVWIGAMLGGVAGYWLSRRVWAEPAKRLLGRYDDKLHGLRSSSAFLTTARFQLMPIVPFGVFNYAAGATRLGFVPYLLGTAIGIVPGTVAAVYVGAELASGLHGGGKRPFIVAGAVMAALLAISFIPTLIDKIRKR